MSELFHNHEAIKGHGHLSIVLTAMVHEPFTQAEAATLGRQLLEQFRRYEQVVAANAALTHHELKDCDELACDDMRHLVAEAHKELHKNEGNNGQRPPHDA